MSNSENERPGGLSHAVVRDLLPSYIEGLTSEETNEAVKAHLDGCGDCSTAWEAMAEAGSAPQPATQPEAGVRYLKKVRRRQGLTVVAVVLVVLGIVAAIMVPLYNSMKNHPILPMPVNGVAEYEVWRLEDGDLYFRITFDEAYPIVSSDSREMEQDGELRQVWFFGYAVPQGFYSGWMSGATDMRLDLEGLDNPADVLMVAQEGTDEVLTLWREGDEVPDAPPGIEALAASLGPGGSTWYRYGAEAERAQTLSSPEGP